MAKGRKITPEFKVMILRELLDNQVPAGKLSEEYGIHINLIYKWKKELFSHAGLIFVNNKSSNSESDKLTQLEKKLKQKDSLISEIVEDNIRLKKKLIGEI